MTIPFGTNTWCVDGMHILRGPDGDVRVSAGEIGVLKALLAVPGRVVARAMLLSSAGCVDDALKVHISRLRSKMASVGITDTTIGTAHGEGYLLCCRGDLIETRTFTLAQMKALHAAIRIAEQHEPGIRGRIGLA